MPRGYGLQPALSMIVVRTTCAPAASARHGSGSRTDATYAEPGLRSMPDLIVPPTTRLTCVNCQACIAPATAHQANSLVIARLSVHVRFNPARSATPTRPAAPDKRSARWHHHRADARAIAASAADDERQNAMDRAKDLRPTSMPCSLRAHNWRIRGERTIARTCMGFTTGLSHPERTQCMNVRLRTEKDLRVREVLCSAVASRASQDVESPDGEGIGSGLGQSSSARVFAPDTQLGEGNNNG